MDKLFNLYKQVLLAHIATKTTEPLFHEKSEEFYELLFKCFHSISEKRQDNGLDYTGKCSIHIKNTYEALESAKEEIEKMISEENSTGMDNLLRWLADELESACGSARGFLEEEEEEPEEPEEAPEPTKEKRLLFLKK